MAKRSPKDIADELDQLGTRLSGTDARQIFRLAAELRGEEVEPTPNEVRAAEKAKAAEEQAKADEAAAKEQAKNS